MEQEHYITVDAFSGESTAHYTLTQLLPKINKYKNINKREKLPQFKICMTQINPQITIQRLTFLRYSSMAKIGPKQCFWGIKSIKNINLAKSVIFISHTDFKLLYCLQLALNQYCINLQDPGHGIHLHSQHIDRSMWALPLLYDLECVGYFTGLAYILILNHC